MHMYMYSYRRMGEIKNDIFLITKLLTVLLRGRFCEVVCEDTWGFPANRLAHVDAVAARCITHKNKRINEGESFGDVYSQ